MDRRTLPLFPLPIVLLPGTPLPLHIFEPRYRRMLADCLAGDRRFGLIYQSPSEPGLEPGRVGCIARIEESEQLEDGRSNILVVGEERFVYREAAPSDAPYLVGAVEAYEDETEPADMLAMLAAAARELFERVGRAARLIADDRDPLPALTDEPGRLSFGIASLVDLDLATRQRILGSRSPAWRLREIVLLLERALAPIEQRAAVHQRAKGNGHGPRAEA